MSDLDKTNSISPVKFLSRSSPKESSPKESSPKESSPKESLAKKSKKSKKSAANKSGKRRTFFRRRRRGSANLRNRINALKYEQNELKEIKEQANYYYRAYPGSKQYYRQEVDNNSRALYNIIFKMYGYFNKLLNVCSKDASKINTQVEEIKYYPKINVSWWRFRQMFIILRDTIEKCINDKTIRKYIKKNKLEKTNDKNLKALINKKFVEFKSEAHKLIRDGDDNMDHYKYDTTKSTPMSFYSAFAR